MSSAPKVSKVFISHGHSEVAKLKLKAFLQDRLATKPVILAEQPDLGLTVVEKLERYGRECDFALILLTADDQMASGSVRARQNVAHELGFFHGILGRDKVLLLKESGVELFSNISGLIYKEFAGNGIESVFEDIRIALESSSAQRVGQTVPSSQNPAYRQAVAFELSWLITAVFSGSARHPLAVREMIQNYAAVLEVRLPSEWWEHLGAKDHGLGAMALLESLGGQLVAREPQLVPYLEAGFNLVLDAVKGGANYFGIIEHLEISELLRHQGGDALARINLVHDHFQTILRGAL